MGLLLVGWEVESVPISRPNSRHAAEAGLLDSSSTKMKYPQHPIPIAAATRMKCRSLGTRNWLFGTNGVRDLALWFVASIDVGFKGSRDLRATLRLEDSKGWKTLKGGRQEIQFGRLGG